VIQEVEGFLAAESGADSIERSTSPLEADFFKISPTRRVWQECGR